MMLLPSTTAELAGCLDQTLLRPEASAAAIRHLCGEAATLGFCTVCVNGSRVLEAYHLLADSTVKVCGVVGFPLGATDPGVKYLEAETAIDHGAQELDMVINIGRFKDGDRQGVLREVRDVVEAAEGLPVKVILEMSLLTAEEIRHGCDLVMESGAKWVKTSTGFGMPPVTPSDVALLRSCVGPEFGVKAAGGIRSLDALRALIEAGATRCGTSAGAQLIRAFRESRSQWPPAPRMIDSRP